ERATNDVDRAIAHLDGLRDRMCACPDDTCAAQVGGDHKIWARDHKALVVGSDEAASDAQVGRAVRIEVAYAACKKKKLGSAAERAIKKMVEFKNRMCLCPNRACADAVSDEMTKWSQQMAMNADQNARVSKEDSKAMESVAEEFTQCATKAMTAGMTP